ncbi:MAG TPA: SUMF1/EgtB/PvdO family nonheme iron enzyme [Gammaproteobacteria bacterium]|nr:SUMF1/EgtB/PvdO family nonheme iron enzyme [Gammaproteobacteria bacterium]
MFANLLRDLDQCRQELLQCCPADEEYRTQYHPDLSPAGWHVGHCIFTENYWIREILLGRSCDNEDEKSLYIPEYSTKPKRGASLPEHAVMIDWAGKSFSENNELLRQYCDDGHELLRDNFLLHFLVQHYSQHLETLAMSRCQAGLKKTNGGSVNDTLVSRALKREALSLPAGYYPVGRKEQHRPYDNESPAHAVEIDPALIAKCPVTNAEYLRFIERGGYDTKCYWSDAGWQWLQNNQVSCPEYWHQSPTGGWCLVGTNGLQSLLPENPVYGINHHEATAFANWANARLPHEHEWEAAFNLGLLQHTGRVWEWCRNTFYPYDGFRAWPYEGYSVPYFDNAHYTLKGGSTLTRRVIKRPSFRNYYEADKRFIFAGIRLVFNK